MRTSRSTRGCRERKEGRKRVGEVEGLERGTNRPLSFGKGEERR